MGIIANNQSAFDSVVENEKAASAGRIAAAIEAFDRLIYSRIDHGRFAVVRNKPRTVATSAGDVTYRRRYYRDSLDGTYYCPADMALGLGKRVRISNELRVRLVLNASEMSYSLAARTASEYSTVSKATVCRAVAKAKVESTLPGLAAKGPSGGARIHVQIDEKYVSIAGSRRKTRLYTATIFRGREAVGRKGRKRLKGRTITSSRSPKRLGRMLSSLLAGRYGVTADDTVWLSGDLASYIVGFGESITACKAVYVPDKWHVCHMVASDMGESVRVSPELAAEAVKAIAETGDVSSMEGLACLPAVKICMENPKVFDPWFDPSYEGCSQEGMNSHYYARRFAKCPNRFKESTVLKLSSIIESRQNAAAFSITFPAIAGPDSIDDVPWIGKPYEELPKYSLNIDGMPSGSRKVFTNIKFGGLE